MSRAADPVAPRLLRWFDTHGRHDLPWQHPRTPYRVWLSEIMLQQTQVATVLRYFGRFVDALPTLADLAAAPPDDVLALWSGLGYYSRARNLQRAAQVCVAQHDGDLPRDRDALAALPGIGRSTAGAILAQAFGQREPILDGNVKRVLTRLHGIAGWPGESAIEKQLWTLADAHTPAQRVADYTQAIMDLGATLCTRAKPLCTQCPLRDDCVAFRDGLTAALPTRKPARARPTRGTVMLVLRDAQGRVLLERRAERGIWGGLWSLPETAAADATPAAITATHHVRVTGALRELPAFSHDFTHFRLEVTPLTAEAVESNAHAADDTAQRRWLLPREAAALGLPAPVRTLLASLDQG